MIKSVIVGSGMMGVVHSEALHRIPGVEVAAIADVNEAAAKKYAEQLGIPKYYTDYKEMLAAEKPDVVHICTPNFLHFEVAKYAIEQGCGVYCEKPLALDSKQGEELTKLAKEKGVPNAVNFNYRNNAMVRDMHERIISGDAGKTYFVHGHYLQDWLMYDTDFSWRLDPSRNGVSRAVADIGSHWFDTAQFATGKKITKVFAKLNTVIPERIKPLAEVATFAKNDGKGETVKIDSEDLAVIMVEFEDGTLGSTVISQISGGHKNDLMLEVDTSKYSMKWEQENADKLYVCDRIDGNRLIYASAGTVTGDAARFAPIPEGHAVAWKDALKNGINEFYNAVKAGTYKDANQSYATFETGWYILKLVDACLESSKTDKWVEVK